MVFRASVLLLAIVLVAGCVKPQEVRGPLAEDDEGDVGVRVGEVTPAPAADVHVNAMSPSFAAPGGLVRVELHTSDPGPWRLDVLTSDGDEAGDVFAGNGTFDGARWVWLSEGAYNLSYNGTGPWNATVATDTRAAAAPRAWDGTGDGATSGVHLEKGTTVAFNLTSDGPARASILGPDGRTIVTLATSRNSTSEEARMSIRTAGVYVVNVESDATWRLRAEV